MRKLLFIDKLEGDKKSRLKKNIYLVSGCLGIILIILLVNNYIRSHRVETATNFESYPAELPRDLIVDLQKFDSSSYMRSKEGVSIVISYITPNTIDKVISAYSVLLRDKGWAVASQSTTIIATKGEESVTYSLTAQGDATKVTINYNDVK
jgi:hypothetical protein